MERICKRLMDWYAHNKRELPWRDTKDPYKIWVSEVILQQTRVNQGLSYYYNFTENYPNVNALANSSIDELMRVWQGLGYYSRARNMHSAAIEIVNKYEGEFPSDYNSLLKLKGIGQYTASAIASIAFNYPVPVLDGNVFRVLSRLFGIYESTQTATGKSVFLKKAQEIIANDDPGTFNQSIMEFGAMQCTPLNPDCRICPLKTVCYAFGNNKLSELPVKKNKLEKRIRYFNYIYIIYTGNTFIEKRTGNDIWKLLYQLPLIETNIEITVEELIKTEAWKEIFEGIGFTLDIYRYKKNHILSHQKLVTSIYKVQINEMSYFIKNNYKKIPINKINDYGFPRLIDNYFELNNN